MAFGRFVGEVVAKWLKHKGADRNMQLLEDFAYIDPDGLEWKAPKGSKVNGASIPEVLWASIGPPFVGDYRRASVVHDVACDARTQPHEAAHRMFYHAMRADGVGWVKANTMYQAVKRFGPTWGATGSLRRQAKAKDEEVLQYLEAVEQAARQVKEPEGLDAVEAAANDILVAKLQSAKASKPSRTRKKPTKEKKTSKVSRLTSVRRKPRQSEEESSPSVMAADALAPSVRKQLESCQSLRCFRAGSISPLVPRTKSTMSAASVQAAVGAAEGALPGDAEDGLSSGDRIRLVNQALVLIEDNYVHRPLKESLYGINPVQKLKLLREQLLGNSDQPDFEGDLDFHRKLLEIFLSTRDLHTNYVLPSPFQETTAFVPFLVEDYFDANDQPNQRRFLVTRVVGDIQDSSFAPGVEIVRWNGVPVERAVEINGQRFAGSNNEASRARGLETLTVRPMMQSLPPDADFVQVEYRTAGGVSKEIRFDWMVFSPDTASLAALQQLEALTAVAQGIDLEQTMVRLAKKVLFAPEAVAAEKQSARRKASTAAGQELASTMPSVLTARAVEVDGREYGYVRIRTFSVNSADQFVAEFVRLAEHLPQNGLIIDVRGNGGGLILAGEQLLQVLTPREIEPTLFQFIASPLNRRIVEKNVFLDEWKESMRRAVQTGAAFSQGFPITSKAKANELGQRYHGPVVLITDALCYSTTDIFAAGFQDHNIGTIIGTDNNTGAGGANVWRHDLLSDLVGGDSASPYEALPSNASMRVSIRRTLRVGASNGTILEDFGVVPNVLHPMTRDDLLNGNVDLLARAAEILDNQEARKLRATFESGSASELAIETVGIDRVDIYDGNRPMGSIDVEDGVTSVSLDAAPEEQLKLVGFENDDLVASRLV